VRPRLAGGLISRPSPDAEEQSAAQPAVRPDSVSPEAAAGFRHPSELPAPWSPLEEPRAGASDAGVPACWERPVLRKHVLQVQPRAVASREQPHVKYELRSATAGADRKVSDLAWEPVERAVPESEFRAARQEAQEASPLARMPVAGAAGPRARLAARRSESPGLAARPRPLLRAWGWKARATARATGQPQPYVQPVRPTLRSPAIRSIPRSAGASLQSRLVHRSSWSGFSFRRHPAPGACRGSRWVSPRVRGPAR
jgi:hypothetical protein